MDSEVSRLCFYHSLPLTPFLRHMNTCHTSISSTHWNVNLSSSLCLPSCKVNLRHFYYHTDKCTYIKFHIKTFKIAPTCFDPKIILRELRCSLLKSFKKINQWVFLKCDFSKKQRSSLKMILGSKHVRTILNVLM